MQNLTKNLEKKRTLFWMFTGLIIVIAIGITDFLTGNELSLSLFYLIPIILVTWFAGRNPGLVICAVSTITWLIADALAGGSYSHPYIRYWNAAIRLGFFIVVTLLLPALKALGYEKEMARIDDLTGVSNRRHFFEVAQTELDRSRRYRHAFTIAYIDLDDFKTVNDQWGHKIGDKLLCTVANQARENLRKMDMIARMGGDEFILLLPETDQDASQAIISRIQSTLLDEMQQNNWPVTFSIGVLTCRDPFITTDELIKRADELMYSVKKNGKNAVVYSIYAG